MSILLHNPIAEMDVLYFSLLYGGAVGIAFLIARSFQNDSTKNLPPYQIPTRPDPYEIAYLCGGTNLVLELICLALPSPWL